MTHRWLEQTVTTTRYESDGQTCPPGYMYVGRNRCELVPGGSGEGYMPKYVSTYDRSTVHEDGGPHKVVFEDLD